MAIVVGSTNETIELRISFVDEADETAVQTIVFDGSTTDTEIQNYLTNLEVLTNAYFTAKVVRIYPVTGIVNSGKPAAAVQSLLSSVLAMQFEAEHPLNSAKTVTKQVLIPAYINALRDDSTKPHKPVTNNSNLNALTAILALNLDYLAVTGTHYTPLWSFNTGSKFGTKLSVTDGI